MGAMTREIWPSASRKSVAARRSRISGAGFAIARAKCRRRAEWQHRQQFHQKVRGKLWRKSAGSRLMLRRDDWIRRQRRPGGGVRGRDRWRPALWRHRAGPTKRCDCRRNAGPRARLPMMDGAARFPIVRVRREESFVWYQEFPRERFPPETAPASRIFLTMSVVE